MPRKILLESRNLPYHISARANNREPFPGELEHVWRVLTDELYLQTILHGARIHAFVLMPNHFHLLLTTPDAGVNVIMKEFLGSSTRILNTRYRRWGRIFGGRYHWSLVTNPLYYAHALKYVYRNPVKAGLCDYVSDYPFSTFSGLCGLVKLPLPLHAPLENMNQLVPTALEEWLNRPHKAEENCAIGIGLRKKTFAPPVNRSNRKRIELPSPE